jgi:HD-GYP domain-containing protein (c-di-GMP phosphodiesterase class II)/DNA-binding CsgD family transcriptional regulator
MTSLRLADLLCSVSLVSDLGFALPPGESMRSGIIATRLARQLGLGERDVADVFYTALLQHLGCAGFAHETAAIYDDEFVVNAAAARTDSDDLRDVIDTFIRATTRGRSPLAFARVAAYTLVRGSTFGRRFATARCEVGRETARRLGLPDGVQRGLHEVAESWNGQEGVQGLRGDDIAPGARIVAVAATVARFDDIGGEGAAVETVRRRAGRLLDPTVASAFVERAPEILDEARAADPRATLLAAEPAPTREVPEPALPDVAAAIGDVADLKSTFTLGHASGVAALATEAAMRLDFTPDAIGRLRVAALLHDLGRVGVSTGTWERPGPLTADDRERVRLHPYHTERILARSEALAPVARLAGMHHERLDGSGYHRGSTGRDLGPEALVLACADAFQAMTQPRPHRTALDVTTAADQLEAEVRGGRLDGGSATAVIEASGLGHRRRTRVALPANLTEREVDVLRLVARGSSNREIAARLVVSPRTAEHHVQHIYTKIGTSSRAAAALFAMEHDLLDPS